MLLTLGKLHSKILTSTSSLESLKSREDNDSVVVQEYQGGLVLLPVAEDAGQLLWR